MTHSDEIPDAVRKTLAALAAPQPMRRGSLSERTMKCNKPGCPCAEHPQSRHGPYFSLTRTVDGTTRSRLLSTGQATAVRLQIETGQRFRRQLEAHWKACEQWADVQIKAPEAETAQEVKKKGSKRPLPRPSSRRLQRS